MTAQLHVVSGKGGVGKTTVACALALSLANRGQRVLVAEVEGRQGISQAFDVPPLDATETHIARGQHAGEVVGLSVDAKAALLEYLQMFYKLGRAGGLLEKFGAIDFATTIAPGVRDVLLIGKVYEAARRTERHRRGGADLYDAVVLDAPPTGRIGKFLEVNREVSGLAKMGPIKRQADSIMQLLTSPNSRVHLVTLLEEMPVQETLEAVTELRGLGMPLGHLIVNQERPSLLDADARKQMQRDPVPTDALADDLRAVGLRVGPTLLGGLTTAGRDLADRLDLQDRERGQLDRAGLPVAHLPAIPDGLDQGGLLQLATALAQQSVGGGR